MSVELITTVSATVAAVLSVIGASWAMYRAAEKRADARFEKFEGDFTELRGDMTDMKISIARLEGPRPRFEVSRPQ